MKAVSLKMLCCWLQQSMPERRLAKDVIGHTKKSGLETAIFSVIAEGDENMTAVYQTMTVDGLTGLSVLTKEMVRVVTRRAEVDMKRVEKDLLRAEFISLCFLLDTHGMQ